MLLFLALTLTFLVSSLHTARAAFGEPWVYFGPPTAPGHPHIVSFSANLALPDLPTINANPSGAVVTWPAIDTVKNDFLQGIVEVGDTNLKNWCGVKGDQWCLYDYALRCYGVEGGDEEGESESEEEKHGDCVVI